jgi:hypothetical protein
MGREHSPEFDHTERVEGSKGKLHVEYSAEADVEIVQETLKEFQELTAQGYAPNLPKTIQARVERGEELTAAEVAEAVNADYQAQDYAAKSDVIIREWSEHQADFLQKLGTLGLPVQEAYILRLTKYGVGGEFRTPNSIIANVEDAHGAIFTIEHEIIHLTIEQLIKEHTIDHWTKERVVDLIYSRFYPERTTLQKDPEQADHVMAVFEQHYPNIPAMLSELGRARQLKHSGQ